MGSSVLNLAKGLGASDVCMAAKAVLLLACLVIFIPQNVLPAFGHYVLGRQTGSAPFRLNDSDLLGHVPGLTGYVWPGAGLAALDPTSGLGGSGPFTAFPLGYRSPFALGQDAHGYGPFSSILASTPDHSNKGDLILAINFTCPEATPASDDFAKDSTQKGCVDLKQDVVFNSIALYIPPEFQPPINWERGDTSNIVTTITNDYQMIEVHKSDRWDPFGPLWWTIFVRGEIRFSLANHFSEWYYLRLNEMTAPQIAGRYFFKIFVDSMYPARSTVLDSGMIAPLLTAMPAENWPVLLVKGEVDPGIITGTARYGSLSRELDNQPIRVAGKVRAVGVASDPQTGSATGRPVEAWGFFNASARGHYEIEGVAPGIYEIWASAAGFPEQKAAEQVVVHPRGFVELDLLLMVGPTIAGEIISNNGSREDRWPTRRPVLIEIFDDNSWNNLGDPAWEQSHLKAFSPIDLTTPPYTSYVLGDTVWTKSSKPFDTPPIPRAVAFPWEGPANYHSFAWNSSLSVGPKEPLGVFDGVGPPQVWWVDPAGFPTSNADPATAGLGSSGLPLGSTPTRFRWQFGSPGIYGAPAVFDGHVPQVFATWTDGLGLGKYFLRAWVTQYLQTDANGAFVEYQFTVSDDDPARSSFVPVVLRLGGFMCVTVHFRDLPTSFVDSPIGGPDPGRYIIAEAHNTEGSVVSFNFTYSRSVDRITTISLYGSGMAGPNNVLPIGGPGVVGMKYSMLRYRHVRDYGIPAGTYSIAIYVRGYIQASASRLSIGVGASQTFANATMHRGGALSLAVFSEGFENPSTPRNWVWPNAQISIIPFRSDGTSMGQVRVWNGERWLIPSQTSLQNSFPPPGSMGRPRFDGSSALEMVGPDSEMIAAPAKSDVGIAAGRRGMVFASGFLWDANLYRDRFGVTAVALPTDMYSIRVFTYGYVQRSPFTTLLKTGSVGEMRLNVVVGLSFKLVVKFKREGLFAPSPFSMSMRIRIFDELGQLVAASTTSKAYPQPSTSNFIPAGVKEVAWELAGFYSYAEVNGRGFPSYGVSGFPDYRGGWSVELDAVNWYDPEHFFPAVDGILLGESYHTVGGTDFGITGSAHAFNHLGPWEQHSATQISSTPLSGEASATISLDLRGLVRGAVIGQRLHGEDRPISWAQIEFKDHNTLEISYSLDGFFEAYLNSGNYTAAFVQWTPRGEGHEVVELPVTLAEGSRLAGIVVSLGAADTPVSETKPPASLTLLLISVPLMACLKVRRPASEGWSRKFHRIPHGDASVDSCQRRQEIRNPLGH